MSFVPALPLGGYAGWAVLKRTQSTQQAAFDKQPALKRDEAYFRSKIGQINSADELVADRRLLQIALGAYGLEGDLDNKFFVRKILSDGTLKPDALAMKLADKRYREFSAAFGFGDFKVPRSKLSDFPDKILTLWKERQFESAVGQVDDSLRLAMNARRELAKIARSSGSEDTKWFTLMGQRPLRQVMETAFGLPKSFGTLDIDRQKTMLKQKAKSMLGDERVSQFNDPARIEALMKRYLLRAQLADGAAASPGSAALTLLSQVPRPKAR